MRDTDSLIERGEKPPPLARASTSMAALLGPAPTNFVNYDAELWLPTVRASFSSMSQFVLYPWLSLTTMTFFLASFAHLFESPPWWATIPPFAHTVLGGALSFLMVFRTNTAYSRWWEARLMWGQVTIGCRNIVAQSGAMMADTPARLELLSLLMAFPITLKNALRDEPTKSSELSQAEALATEAQQEGKPALRKLCAAPSAPLVLLEAISRSIRAGINTQPSMQLASTAYLHLSEEVRSLTMAATACERIKTSPMPLGYVSALRAFLLLWLFSLPLTMVGPYGHAAAPAVATIAFLFLNLENVALEIEQPFGRDANDLPLETYCNGIERAILNVLRFDATAGPEGPSGGESSGGEM